jgi:hypothetical protein
MLSDKAFEQWCLRLGLSGQAKAIIIQIRTSPPARHVQSGASNLSGTYPSVKMRCSIQFKSHRDEPPEARSTAMLVRETLMNRQGSDQRGEIVCQNLLPMHLHQTCVKP